MTTLEKINKQLIKIKEDLQHGDVNRCAEIAGLSKYRASNYLNGQGRQADTAIKILKAAKKIIAKREKALL